LKQNILIAYYSRSANTRTIAKLIHGEVGGTIFEIQPERPYPVDYNTVVDQAKKEIQAGYRPGLKSKIDNIEVYDTLFIGSPNWWSTIAPPVASFLTEYGLSGKTIVPFCTHGGGGQARVLQDIARLCPGSKVLPGFDIYGDGGSGAKAKVSSWLSKIETAY
jgi:flavodoxin